MDAFGSHALKSFLINFLTDIQGDDFSVWANTLF